MAFANVDEYVSSLPEPARMIAAELRQRARRAAPNGVETIAYNIPTIKVDGRSVIHFAIWKSHIAVYPAPEGDHELARELEPHRAAKGTLRFPLEPPVPYDLIERVFRQQAARRGGTDRAS